MNLSGIGIGFVGIFLERFSKNPELTKRNNYYTIQELIYQYGNIVIY